MRLNRILAVGIVDMLKLCSQLLHLLLVTLAHLSDSRLEIGQRGSLRPNFCLQLLYVGGLRV